MDINDASSIPLADGLIMIWKFEPASENRAISIITRPPLHMHGKQHRWTALRIHMWTVQPAPPPPKKKKVHPRYRVYGKGMLIIIYKIIQCLVDLIQVSAYKPCFNKIYCNWLQWPAYWVPRGFSWVQLEIVFYPPSQFPDEHDVIMMSTSTELFFILMGIK